MEVINHINEIENCNRKYIQYEGRVYIKVINSRLHTLYYCESEQHALEIKNIDGMKKIRAFYSIFDALKIS